MNMCSGSDLRVSLRKAIRRAVLQCNQNARELSQDDRRDATAALVASAAMMLEQDQRAASPRQMLGEADMMVREILAEGKLASG